MDMTSKPHWTKTRKATHARAGPANPAEDTARILASAAKTPRPTEHSSDPSSPGTYSLLGAIPHWGLGVFGPATPWLMRYRHICPQPGGTSNISLVEGTTVVREY